MLSRATQRLGRISIRRWKSSYAAAEEVVEQGGKETTSIFFLIAFVSETRFVKNHKQNIYTPTQERE